MKSIALAAVAAALCVASTACSGASSEGGASAESAFENAPTTKTTAADWTGDYDNGFLVHVDAAGFLTATNRDFTDRPCEYTLGGQTDGSSTVDVTAYRSGEEIKGKLERTATGVHLTLDSVLGCGMGQVQDAAFARTSAGEPGILGYWGVKSGAAAIFKGERPPVSGFQSRIDVCRDDILKCKAPFVLQDQAFSVLEMGDGPWVKVAFTNGPGAKTTGWVSAKDLYAHPAGTLGGACGGDADEDGTAVCHDGLRCDEPKEDFTVGVCKPAQASRLCPPIQIACTSGKLVDSNGDGCLDRCE